MNAIDAAKRYIEMEYEIREIEIKHHQGNDKKWSELVGKQAQLGVRYAVDWAEAILKQNGS